MQLKRATDILLRIFVYLASHPDENHVSIHDLSEALNWNKNLVIKVAHLAVQQGYLKAVRGRTGGVSLAKPAREYRVGDIVRLTEVNEELVECDEPRCPLLNGGCRLRGAFGTLLRHGARPPRFDGSARHRAPRELSHDGGEDGFLPGAPRPYRYGQRRFYRGISAGARAGKDTYAAL